MSSPAGKRRTHHSVHFPGQEDKETEKKQQEDKEQDVTDSKVRHSSQEEQEEVKKLKRQMSQKKRRDSLELVKEPGHLSQEGEEDKSGKQ